MSLRCMRKVVIIAYKYQNYIQYNVSISGRSNMYDLPEVRSNLIVQFLLGFPYFRTNPMHRN